MGTLIFSGVFDRHPGLKVVCVEADAGWVPHYMYRMDHAYKRHRYWMKAPPLERMPSEYFAEHIYVTFQDDWVAFKTKDLCNVRRLMWASDFPHSDSTWPQLAGDARPSTPAPHRTGAQLDLPRQRGRALRPERELRGPQPRWSSRTERSRASSGRSTASRATGPGARSASCTTARCCSPAARGWPAWSTARRSRRRAASTWPRSATGHRAGRAVAAEAGALDIADPIRKIIPELPAHMDGVTLEHLLAHTGGVRDYLSLGFLAGVCPSMSLPRPTCWRASGASGG